ncbi:hypothetical protein CISIN_1g030160mg [Citrus sinensis]|uniref:Uncharacterized protein n=1 Tax=Citrus sinensis TaxID=2711 RepID=A0A067ENH0_CITSI|nr:hypothetical protein CISIN_1g030160mg [Citrus sinensis]
MGLQTLFGKLLRMHFTSPHLFENAGATTFRISYSKNPSERIFTSKFTRFDPDSNAGSASHADGCSKTEERVCGGVDLEEDAGPGPDLANKMETGRMAKLNVGKPSIFGTSANATKNRKRKPVIESNESSETSNYAEELDLKIQDKSRTSPGDNFRSDANQQLRRSSREMKNVEMKIVEMMIL